ncbi:MAG: hypothetical protein QF535_05665, partial [Anaerolineales bacterium]|nr:hypothetical protein [Anaerolineales bacterium]
NTWYHVAVVRDGSDLELYIDGTQTGSTYDISSSTIANIAWPLEIGYYSYLGSSGVNGYMDEIRISNSTRYTGAFTPSTTAFTTDANTKLLIHSDFNGGIDADNSGNTNDFSATNLVATDQMVDTPTNNFCTWTPLFVTASASPTFTEGNLKIATPSGSAPSNGLAEGTLAIPTSGKWYWEAIWESGSFPIVGVTAPDTTGDAVNSEGRGYYYDGTKWGAGSTGSYGNSYTTGDVIGVAVDMDNGALYFAKNNTWQDSGDPTSGASKTGAAYTDLLSSTDFSGGILPSVSDLNSGTSATWIGNFGQDSSFAGEKTAQGNQDGNEKGDFYYEPPTDYLALCTSNLSAPEIALPGENFNTLLYTGTGSTNARTGLGFQPD